MFSNSTVIKTQKRNKLSFAKVEAMKQLKRKGHRRSSVRYAEVQDW